jgi:hypothetical protein
MNLSILAFHLLVDRIAFAMSSIAEQFAHVKAIILVIHQIAVQNVMSILIVRVIKLANRTNALILVLAHVVKTRSAELSIIVRSVVA